MGYYPQESLKKTPYKYHGSTRTLGVHPSLSLENTVDSSEILLTSNHLSHEINPPTFYYTGWLIGILIMVYYIALYNWVV